MCSLIEVYFDGLCQPINPGGIACYAFLIRRNGKIVYSDSGLAREPFSDDSTNNVAEYVALARALEWLIQNNLLSERIEIRSDSQLVVNQLMGSYKVRAKRIIPLYKKVLQLKSEFRDVHIQWVPREMNREADVLTNKAYNRALQEKPEYFARVKKGKGS
jgi:ribonuclease HI